MDTAHVVLVTNVGQGFGRAIALAFGQAGHDVVCADRDVELASKTAAEIEELGGQAIPIQADMTTLMDVQNAFNKVYEIFGDLNGVAHVVSHDSQTPFHRLGENEWAELVEEDLKSTFLTMKVAARLLSAGAWLVLVGPPGNLAEPQMAALRGALEGLSGAFGRRYKRLRANLVIPSRSASDPRHDADLVNSVLFLGSNAARGVAGQTVPVELPPPPRVSEALLPEVRAALDPSVRQDDLEASLYEEDEDDAEYPATDEAPAGLGADGELDEPFDAYPDQAALADGAPEFEEGYSDGTFVPPGLTR